jgi:hypothetical protein
MQDKAAFSGASDIRHPNQRFTLWALYRVIFPPDSVFLGQNSHLHEMHVSWAERMMRPKTTPIPPAPRRCLLCLALTKVNVKNFR